MDFSSKVTPVIFLYSKKSGHYDRSIKKSTLDFFKTEMPLSAKQDFTGHWLQLWKKSICLDGKNSNQIAYIKLNLKPAHLVESYTFITFAFIRATYILNQEWIVLEFLWGFLSLDKFYSLNLVPSKWKE